MDWMFCRPCIRGIHDMETALIININLVVT